MSIYYAQEHPNGEVTDQKIVHDFIDTSMLESIIKEVTTPEVGELKLLAVPKSVLTRKAESIKTWFTWSGNRYVLQAGKTDADGKLFDGWVFPNGKTYAIKDSNGNDVFGVAHELWGTSSTQFKVPSLSSFLKLDPNIADNDGDHLKHVPFKTTTPIHTHSFASTPTTEDKIVQSTFSIWSTDGYSSSGSYLNKSNPADIITVHSHGSYMAKSGILQNYAPGFHAGEINGEEQLISQDMVIESGISIEGATSSVGTSEETMPSHTVLPVMVYIGKPQES